MRETLETFASELVALVSPYGRAQFEGREHIIAPVVMLVEGVHRDLYYPPDELANTPETWNNVPVTVNHPMRNGVPISATDPKIIEAVGVGRVFNARWDGSRLRAEAWIDVEKAGRVAPEVLTSLSNGQPLEISTGVYTDSDGLAGNWNGEAYSGTARNYRPNHLALLPYAQGACNWADGCGIRLNSAPGGALLVPETGVPVPNKLIALGIVVTEAQAGAFREVAETMGARFHETEIAPGPVPGASGEALPEPGGANAGPTVLEEEKTTMDRNAMIERLAGGCECSRFTTDDRPFLETLTDEQLAGALELPAVTPPAPAAPPVAPPAPAIMPAAPVALTADQYVASAPPAVAEVLRRALAREQAEKDALVASLVANSRNRFTEAALRDKGIDELTAMVDLAAITVNYAGQGGGPVSSPPSGPPPMPATFEVGK